MNEQYHILVVDDEIEMTALITSYLRKERFQVSTANDGNELLQKINDEAFDLIVLDIMMPHMNGFALCERIRKFSDIPIIMLTAKGEEADRVHGLKIGADDYLVKPFAPRELIARIEALLRRSNFAVQTLLKVGDMVINPDARTVEIKDQLVELTRKEYDLLLVLVKNKGKVLSREQLHDLVWGMDHLKGTLRTVDTHIKTLRLKLGKESHGIETVWGVGYKLTIFP